MSFNITHGSTHLITVVLIIVMLAAATIGFTYFILKWDQRNANLVNNSTNISGIAYYSEEFNATNNTIHGVVMLMPNLAWILIIFGILAFLTLFAIGMRH